MRRCGGFGNGVKGKTDQDFIKKQFNLGPATSLLRAFLLSSIVFFLANVLVFYQTGSSDLLKMFVAQLDRRSCRRCDHVNDIIRTWRLPPPAKEAIPSGVALLGHEEALRLLRLFLGLFGRCEDFRERELEAR
jgi:hypothetical protein